MCDTVAVGIDLEHVGAFAGIDLLASRFFSPGEVAALRRMGQEARVPAFYRCWTRKEAIVKGVGLGLSMPLDHFEVDVDRCIGPAVRWTGPEPDLTAAWSLIDLSPDETWAAAVAVGAGDAEVAVHADPALAGSIAL
jgi:4'-phosphopantetheinyl transferase